MPTTLFEILLKEAWDAEKIRSWKDKKNNDTPLANNESHKNAEAIDPDQISLFEVQDG